jgi:hypothetical protein
MMQLEIITNVATVILFIDFKYRPDLSLGGYSVVE